MPTIKGLTLEINGNVTPLNKALSSMAAVSKELKDELRDVESKLKMDPANVELAAEKEELLAKAVQQAKEKLDLLKNSAEQVNEKFRNGEITKDQFDGFTASVKKAETEFNKLSQAAEDEKVSGALDRFTANASEANAELRKVNNLLKLDPSNVELLRQKQTLLTQSIDATSGKLGILKEKAAAAEAQMERGEISEKQYREIQRQVVYAETSLKKLEDQAKDTTSSEKKLSTETDKVTDEMQDAGKQTSVFGDVLKANLTGTAIVAGIKAIASKLAELATAAIEGAGTLIKLNSETGISIQRLQEMQYVTTMLDGDMETLARSQAKLTKAMSEAEKGSKNQKEAFEALGISITGSDGKLRDAKDVMYEAFDALGKLGNETERDALAMEIFGRSAQDLNPLIKAGSETIAELSAEAHTVGAVMSDEAVAALDTFGDKVDAIKLIVKNFVGEGLAKLIESTQTSASKVKDLTTAADNCKQVFAESDATYKEAEASTAAAASVAAKYAERLKELEAQGLDTNEAQNEYRRIVDQLNALIPDLNLVIDEQTGLIMGGTDALYDNIEAWKQTALQEAVIRRYTDEIEAWSDAEVELYENQQKLNVATAKRDQLYEKQTKNLEESEKIQLDITAVMQDATLTAEEQGIAIAELELKQAALKQQYSELIGPISDATAEVSIYKKAVEDGKTTVDAYAGSVESAQSTLDGMTETTEENTKAVVIATVAANDWAAALKDQTSSARSLSGEVDTLNDALAEQDENGKLSVNTILELTEAGYAAALQIDEETGAVRLNAEAYKALAQAKINEQIASAQAERAALAAEIKAEQKAVEALGLSYDAMSEEYRKKVEAQQADLAGYDATIAALEDVKDSIGDYVDAEAEASDAFSDETEKINRQLNLGTISQEKYWTQYKSLMDKYLSEGTEAWEDANYTYLKGQKDLSDKLADEQEQADEEALKSQEDADAELAEAREKAAEEELDAKKASFDDLQDAADTAYKNGEISLREYLAQSEAYRDRYLDDDQDAWGTAAEVTSELVQKTMSDRLQSIEDEYDSALSSIRSKIDSMAGKLTSLDLVGTSTNNLFGQDYTTYDFADVSDIEAANKELEAYNANLQALKDAGISESLLDEIVGMDTEKANAYANYLLGLIDKTSSAASAGTTWGGGLLGGTAESQEAPEISVPDTTAWDEYMAAWDERQALATKTAQSYYQGELDTLNAEFTDKLTEQLQTLVTDTEVLGLDVAEGLAEGILSGKSTVANAMAELAATAITAGQTALDSHSPSRLMRDKLGWTIPAGVAEGITENQDLITQAMSGLKNIVAPDFASKVSYALEPSTGGGSGASDAKIADTVARALAAGLAAIGDSIFDAIPKKSEFKIGDKVIAEATWDTFNELGKTKGVLFAPTRETIKNVTGG